jgi:hypothetical protein
VRRAEAGRQPPQAWGGPPAAGPAAPKGGSRGAGPAGASLGQCSASACSQGQRRELQSAAGGQRSRALLGRQVQARLRHLRALRPDAACHIAEAHAPVVQRLVAGGAHRQRRLVLVARLPQECQLLLGPVRQLGRNLLRRGPGGGGLGVAARACRLAPPARAGPGGGRRPLCCCGCPRHALPARPAASSPAARAGGNGWGRRRAAGRAAVACGAAARLAGVAHLQHQPVVVQCVKVRRAGLRGHRVLLRGEGQVAQHVVGVVHVAQAGAQHALRGGRGGGGWQQSGRGAAAPGSVAITRVF